MPCLTTAFQHPLPAGTQGRQPLPGWQRLLRLVFSWLLLLTALVSTGAQPVWAARTTNSYDGNIYALYAGNGSLVPPRSTLAEALADHRPVLLAFFLDDSADSKTFAPSLSELQRLWGSSTELILLPTDPLQGRGDNGRTDPAHYWNGSIPQVVVFDQQGKVRLDASGQVDVDAINAVLSEITGLALPEQGRNSQSFEVNELNSEIVSRS